MSSAKGKALPAADEHQENERPNSFSGREAFEPSDLAAENLSDEQASLLGGENTQPATYELSQGYKVAKTVLMFSLYFGKNGFVEVVGPILPELVAQTSSSYESVMRSISMRGVGFVAGGILAGFSVDRWFEHIDLLMAIAFIIYTSIGVGIGYVVNIDVLFVMFLLQGALEQALRIGCLRMTLKLWNQRSTAPLVAIHMGSSVSYIVTPKVTGFFVDSRFSNPNSLQASAPISNSNCKLIAELNTTSPASNSTLYLEPKYPANFVYAFWIFAAINILVAAMFLLYSIHKQRNGLQYLNDGNSNGRGAMTLTSSMHPKTCSPSKPVLAILVIMAAFWFYGAFIPMFRIFPKMIFSYARTEACMSVEMSTTFQSTYFILMLVGRTVAFLLSSAVHPKYIMQASAVGLVGSSVALVLYAENTAVLWIGVAFIGLSNANMHPCLFGLLNHYIEMTAVALIAPYTGGAIGDVVVMYFLGPDYETNVGPKVLWTYMLVLSIFQCLAVALLQILCHIHGERYQDKKK